MDKTVDLRQSKYFFGVGYCSADSFLFGSCGRDIERYDPFALGFSRDSAQGLEHHLRVKAGHIMLVGLARRKLRSENLLIK